MHQPLQPHIEWLLYCQRCPRCYFYVSAVFCPRTQLKHLNLPGILCSMSGVDVVSDALRSLRVTDLIVPGVM